MIESGRVVGRPFPKGVSGNPSGLPGRPVGSRTTFSAGFTKDLAEVWAEKGKETMLKTAEIQPAVFFATCARLLPQDVKVTLEQALPGNLSPSDWADLRELLNAIQAVVQDAKNRNPGELFRYVSDALATQTRTGPHILFFY
jgi:hypothetical protein